MDFERALDNIIEDNELRAMGKLDYNKSLDEIISDKKQREQKLWYERRRYAKHRNWSNWQQWSYKNRDHRTFQKEVFNYTLMIYQLDKDVTDEDLKYIFEDFGVIVDLSVHYNKKGQSLGMAHLILENNIDALQTVMTYNGIKVNGTAMLFKLEDICLKNSATTRYVSPYKPKGFNRFIRNCWALN